MNDPTLALMTFEDVNLLLPQQQVASIEITTAINAEIKAPGTVGVLRLGQLEWPVYALTAAFAAHANCPQYYHYCVAFNRNEQPAFAIACAEVSTITVDRDKDLEPLQTCMRSIQNPIYSLLMRDDTLMLVSEVDAMQNFLSMGIAA